MPASCLKALIQYKLKSASSTFIKIHKIFAPWILSDQVFSCSLQSALKHQGSTVTASFAGAEGAGLCPFQSIPALHVLPVLVTAGLCWDREIGL